MSIECSNNGNSNHNNNNHHHHGRGAVGDGCSFNCHFTILYQFNFTLVYLVFVFSCAQLETMVAAAVTAAQKMQARE